MRRVRLHLVLFSLLASSGCTTYEYEEEVALEISGSGTIRVSSSRSIFSALHGVTEPTVSSAEAYFESDGVDILSVRETSRENRTFLHVQMRFDDWSQLCQSPPFRGRRCRLSVSEDEQAIELDAPRPVRPLPDDVDPKEILALRFHLPASVHYHNSPSGLERGNILSWERPVGEYFAGRPFSIEARYGRRSILAATVRIVIVATGVVAATITVGIYWMFRKGRRQLEADRAPVG